MAAIRKLHLLLFVAGLFFASFAWMWLITPIGSFIRSHEYSSRDHVLAHTGAILVMSGYVVWFGWFLHAWKAEYLFGPKTFFVLVFFHHLGWLLWFPFIRQTNVFEFASNVLPVFLWIAGNMMVALVGFSLAIAMSPGEAREWATD